MAVTACADVSTKCYQWVCSSIFQQLRAIPGGTHLLTIPLFRSPHGFVCHNRAKVATNPDVSYDLRLEATILLNDAFEELKRAAKQEILRQSDITSATTSTILKNLPKCGGTSLGTTCCWRLWQL